jgi:RNA polymerase sigma factor (sigma-70 family)
MRPQRELVPTAVLRLASDQRLAEQVGAGSERAFEAIFDRYHRSVLAFCRHMLGSHEEAEDVLQQTFLAAYRDLTRSEKTVTLRPWLYAIARHHCVSQLRARRARTTDAAPEPAIADLATGVAAREDLRAVLSDLGRLPDDQRAALVLAELGDVCHEEIGRILRCPTSKVKALVFQARASLAADRAARDAPCAEIREQLATLRGSALRRAALRRHLDTCSDCHAFAEQLRTQRSALGLLLPLAPSVGLKRGVLATIFGSGGDAAVVGGGVLSGGAIAVTALVAVAIPLGAVTARTTAPSDNVVAVPMVETRSVAGVREDQPTRLSTGSARGREAWEPSTSSRRTTARRSRRSARAERPMANDPRPAPGVDNGTTAPSPVPASAQAPADRAVPSAPVNAPTSPGPAERANSHANGKGKPDKPQKHSTSAARADQTRASRPGGAAADRPSTADRPPPSTADRPPPGKGPSPEAGGTPAARPADGRAGEGDSAPDNGGDPRGRAGS